MIWTNKHNLPDAVVKAITHDTYDGGSGDFSATTLLKPPQMHWLMKRHRDKIEQDVVDNVWRLFGQAAHSILEGHAPDDALSEERLYINVAGQKIGGQVDMYHDGTITDYKITSAWSIVLGNRIHEWEEQLNIYAEIFRQNNYKVDALQIVAILRDWDKNRALREPGYPNTPIVVIRLDLWYRDDITRFIEGRVAALVESKDLADNEQPPCSVSDMWESASTYAVMKRDAKRATKVCGTMDEAQDEVERLVGDYRVVTRPGKRVRCESYCQAAPFCCQYQQYKEEIESA